MIKTFEQLKLEWGMEKYVTAFMKMTELILAGDLKTEEQVFKLAKGEPDVFEVFEIYVWEESEKILNENKE